MSIHSKAWPAGTPCWTDRPVADMAAAQAFYAALLGWEYTEVRPEMAGYCNALVDGKQVAGLYDLREGLGSFWNLYIATDDAEATAAAIEANGGTLMMPATAIPDVGSMLVAQDPTGSFFGAFQAGAHTGAQLVNQPGGLAWEDLRSADPVAAKAFYAGVFGYETRLLSEHMPDYETFHRAGEEGPLGGMGGLMGQDMPSHWLVYFSVADIDAAVTTVAEMGGTVMAPPFETPFGRMAPVLDPSGAAFMLTSAA